MTRTIRQKASKGMYLYNEETDELVKVTNCNEGEEDKWQEVDETFAEAYRKRKEAEEAEKAEQEEEPNN